MALLMDHLNFLLKAFAIISLVYRSNGECENGCSGHGRCTLYDMCICNRNWQANDCSESKFTFILKDFNICCIVIIYAVCFEILFRSM